MVAPLIPIIAGIAMAGGGAASFKKGMGVSGLQPRQNYYGGSPEGLDAYRQQYGSGIASGQGQVDYGIGGERGNDGLKGLGSWGEAQYFNREGDINRALEQGAAAREIERQQLRNIGRAANAYQPGAQSAAAAALALKQAGQQNLAMARSGTNAAMGLRNALNANGQAGVDIASQTALIRAQEEQTAVQMREQAAVQAAQAAGALRSGDMGLAGLQTGRQQFGAQTAGSAYGTIASLGAQREGMYVDAQQQMEQEQLNAQMEYERRRQEEQQRKSNAYINLGAGLIGGSGRVMSMGGGGYGGGGGGGGGGGK